MPVCREAEEKRQAVALGKQQAAEAKEREVAAQRAEREAERQALRRLQKNFAVRMEGFAAIDKAPKVRHRCEHQEKKGKHYLIGDHDGSVACNYWQPGAAITQGTPQWSYLL